MKVFLRHLPSSVFIQVRLEGPGMIGDMVREVGPGQGFLGWTYEELRQLPAGENQLADKSPRHSD
jgi:hypothetical protein